MIIGVILMSNPLEMIGFGPLGPIAGSLAAQWQAAMGGQIAAGSAFAILQSWGMTYGVLIPQIGTGIAGVAYVASVAREHLAGAAQRAKVVLGDAGRMIENQWRQDVDPIGHLHGAVEGL
ncbi:hypothetical protein BDN72DRAFT_846988 [Pluteus cervinus]|uniref:Uncharacterized protein n=1 Tax=Pluteus cervinus TaxID=181527 RepID=A0ACD3AED6_9AGAR|nr:hypothetical protein BDN72DRAFT_846988 [Pluteus cervinus]